MTIAATRQTTWDTEVLDALAAHVRAEGDLLADYTLAAQKVEEPDVRYLLGLILEDESRHHRLFREMAHAVQSAQTGQQVEPRVPDPGRGGLSAPMRELTERLLEAERSDRRELRSLRRLLRPVAGTTLWPLLVELMLLDTEKHVRILGAISKRATR